MNHFKTAYKIYLLACQSHSDCSALVTNWQLLDLQHRLVECNQLSSMPLFTMEPLSRQFVVFLAPLVLLCSRGNVMGRARWTALQCWPTQILRWDGAACCANASRPTRTTRRSRHCPRALPALSRSATRTHSCVSSTSSTTSSRLWRSWSCAGRTRSACGTRLRSLCSTSFCFWRSLVPTDPVFQLVRSTLCDDHWSNTELSCSLLERHGSHDSAACSSLRVQSGLLRLLLFSVWHAELQHRVWVEVSVPICAQLGGRGHEPRHISVQI